MILNVFFEYYSTRFNMWTGLCIQNIIDACNLFVTVIFSICGFGCNKNNIEETKIKEYTSVSIYFKLILRSLEKMLGYHNNCNFYWDEINVIFVCDKKCVKNEDVIIDYYERDLVNDIELLTTISILCKLLRDIYELRIKINKDKIILPSILEAIITRLYSLGFYLHTKAWLKYMNTYLSYDFQSLHNAYDSAGIIIENTKWFSDKNLEYPCKYEIFIFS